MRKFTMKRRIAAAAVLATGLLGVGLPAASAHTGSLQASGLCQDNGTRLVTYTGTTNNVPGDGPGHTATLTVGEILPVGAQVSPPTQTVIGNTTFTFTQTIPGDAMSAQATAFLVWGDQAKSDPIGRAGFTTNCTSPVVVPTKPAPEVVVTQSTEKKCDAKTVTTTTVTTTTDWILVDNHWVKGTPVSTTHVTTRATTSEECPVVTPPVVTPPVVTPPVVTPPVVTPPVVVPPGEGVVSVGAPVVVPPAKAAVPAAAPVVVPPAQAAVNPLPTAASAGQADTSGQVTAGVFAGFAGFLALGAGFVLRRRHGDV